MLRSRKMTYHLQNKSVQLSRSIRLDTQKLFPEKLFDVVNDGYLFRWTDGGTWVSVVDENVFEKEVMRRYPGFLQIPSFMNLRRLFREYSFEWRVNEETSQYEFYHPSFQRDQPELLCDIRTRRKSATPLSGRKRSVETVSPLPRTRYAARRLRVREENIENTAENNSLEARKISPETAAPPPDMDSKLSNCSRPTPSPTENDSMSDNFRDTQEKKDMSDLRNTYWRNESDNQSYYSGLPPEVWANTTMPVCPSAVPVEANNEHTNNGNMNYPQQYQACDYYSANGNWPQPEQKSSNGSTADEVPPMNWGWAPFPFFVPYQGEAFGGPSPWGQGYGAGDTGRSVQENKMSQNLHQPMQTYWSYPYPFPWGYPTYRPDNGNVKNSEYGQTISKADYLSPQSASSNYE